MSTAAALHDTAKSSLGVEGDEGGVKGGGDNVDDAVVSLDVARVSRSSSVVGLLSHDGVVEESLPELPGVGEILAVEGFKVATDGGNSVLSLDDVVLEDVRGELLLSGLSDDGVDRGDDGEGSRSLEGLGEASLLNCLNKVSEVVVSLDVVLLVSKHDALGSPAVKKKVKRKKGVGEVEGGG